MKYKKIMFMLVLAVFIFGAAGVCASDVNDTVITGEDDSPVELPQTDTDEVMSSEGDELIGQTENVELLSEGNSGTFAELQANINATTPGSTLTLNKNYECEDGFGSEGILIDKSITIDGNGSKIDAQGKSRIFRITADNVILKNIIFTNGKTTEKGGAIHFSSNGAVINCNFTLNTADDGGAVYFADGTAGETINCNFTDNIATSSGGAVVFLGNGAVTDCNFINNAGQSGSGGAIYFINGTVSDCNFADNTAVYGGAVYFRINGTVTDCCFAVNSATYGGAVYFDGGSYGETVNCIYADNSASHCGAIYSMEALNVVADACIFKSSSDTTDTARIIPPILTVDNFTTLYDFGEKVVFDLKTSSGILINGNISISIYNNSEWIGNFSCLSNDGWTVDLPVGEYYAIYNTEYYGFSPVNRTITVESYKTFCDLNDAINGNVNPVINLFDDFYFDPAYDSCFVDGVVIGRPVTINGNGITIDARGNGKIFHSSAEITIKNLTIKNGNYDGNGAAISFSQVSTVTDCNFTNIHANGNHFGGAIAFNGYGIVKNCNFVQCSANKGGVIYMSSGSVENCSFVHNSAGHGGVIYMSSGSVENCSFEDNSADYGGAVYFIDSGVVSDSNFDDNTAKHGGAVYFNNFGSVLNCNFTDNEVNSRFGHGGAVCFTGAGSVSNCNFTNNNGPASGSDGGAVYFRSTGSVSNCSFVSNSVYHYGGAVYFMDTGSVSNCSFVNNSDSYSGGAVYFSGTGSVSNCNFTNNYAPKGGAVFFLNNGTVLNCNFTDNSAPQAGAVWFESNGNVTYCNFINNSATYYGGAILIPSGSVENCNFIANTAENGGAVYFSGNCNLTNCNFIANTAENGGAVYFSSGNMIYCNFTENHANNRGGAVHINGKGFVINCNFIANTANDGGAIRCSGEGTVINCNFTDNSASAGGAVWFVSNGNVTYCNFIDNHADLAGAVCFEGNGNVTNCYFINNSASNGGAILSMQWRTVTVDTCIFKTDSDTTFNTYDIPPILTVDNFTTDYNSGEKLVFDLKTNSGIPVNNANISMSLYFKNNDSLVGNYSFLSGDKWTVDLPVGYYYAIFNTEYAEFQPINITVHINPLEAELTASAITSIYNVNKALVITLKDMQGNPCAGASVTVDLNGVKTYTTDSNGQIKVSTKGLAPKSYTAKVTFNGDAIYAKSVKDVRVTIKKATPKLTAKKKTFKKSVKSKKYSVTLKTNTGKAMKKVKVTLKVNKKTYTAKTNAKGKATFKIKKLTKKGTYKATVTYKGNAYYNKVTKKVKIKCK